MIFPLIKKEKERRKMLNFDIKNGEELTQLYLRSDVLLLACVFEKIIKVLVKKFDINHLFCVSSPGYTWQCGLKYTGINLQTIQDKILILTKEKNKRSGISAVIGDRHVKSDENKKIVSMEATNLHGHSMIQHLPHEQIEIDKKVTFDETLFTPDDSDIEYFLKVDLKYPDNIKEKTKNFPFAPESKFIHKDKYKNSMKKISTKNYTKAKEINM